MPCTGFLCGTYFIITPFSAHFSNCRELQGWLSLTSKSLTMKVIIIDDDAEDRSFLLQALQAIDNSVAVLEAPTCMDGLQHLDIRIKEPVDYIFLDINMPVTNGKECLGIIKQNIHLKDIPVIMLSTSSYYKDRLECLDAGALVYIVKPSRLNELVEALSFIQEKPPSAAVSGGGTDPVF
jgi:DNA-binding response OmpR family regulator